MTIEIDVNIQEDLWKKQDRLIASKVKKLVQKIASQTSLQQLLEKEIELEISILLTNDDEIKGLNCSYRDKNKPTNVLSFPLLDGTLIKDGDLSALKLESDFLALGDIVISYQMVALEAQEQNKDFQDHLTHLLAHSVLHLIGYDHEAEKDAEIMEGLEVDILKTFSIENLLF